ncbi:TPR-like protein [Ephemerocybe angulata]|uniref:TPR-like protein n=1 Tax=Ephemerocybe angulata TaxID=980116 RepID=A0A8H6M9K5_9AGAR|nr:TPR-like protein [Tulosesus angulatus]
MTTQQSSNALIAETEGSHEHLYGDGVALRKQYETTSDLDDLARAISTLRRAVVLTPEGDANMAPSLACLGSSLWLRFERIGDLQDIADAISAEQQALELTPEGHPDMTQRLAALGASLWSRFERTGDLQDLSEAISGEQRALELTPEGHPDMARRLSSLGISLHSRFESTGNPIDLDGSISAHQRALELTPEYHPGMARRLAALGSSLWSRFESTGDLQVLDEAISAEQRALEITPEGDPDMARRLSAVGASLRSRFKATGDLQALAQAISAQQSALKLTPEGHPRMALQLDNLSVLFMTRFKRAGDLQALDDAIAAGQRAMELTPEGDPDMALRLTNHSVSCVSRYEATGDLQALTKAISAGQRAVELTPEKHPDLALRFANLTASLLSRFKRTGDLQDLAEAISMVQRAVELTPKGHPEMARRLKHLGASLWSRFERTGDLQDLDEAISTEKRALELTPDDHPDLAGQLAGLGASLYSRFEISGDGQDIAKAISMQQRSVELTPEGHPNMAARISNLGTSLWLRFGRTGNPQDIVEAISVMQKAVELTPAGHADRAWRLSNLGVGFESRFQRSGDLQDVAKAISAKREAMELTPEGHVGVTVHLNRLGTSLLSRFQHTGETHDVNEALALFRTSATSEFGPPHDRLNGAEEWVGLLEKYNSSSPDILTAFDVVIRLTTLTTTLDQSLEKRYAKLVDTSGVPLKAASAAFALKRADKALEWLEQGRCLVWRQLTSLRTPLDDLRQHDSHLAESVVELSRKLEGAGSVKVAPRSGLSMSEKVSLEDQARDYLRSAREWDELLTKIRISPGFERFLEPPPWHTLITHLPHDGRVIIINIDSRRCDAIVLSEGQSTPLHVPLTSFSLAKCNQYRQDLSNQLHAYDCRDRGGSLTVAPEGGDECRAIRRVNRPNNGATVVQGILRGLWHDLVYPIIQALGIEKIPTSSTGVAPRIWWCPTGPLSFFPIHAAGIYTSAEGSESVLDYAVSSYIPTIAALTDRVKNSRPIQMAIPGLFMTCQPDAAGGSHIPGTTTEVQAIYELATKEGLRAERLEGSETTPARCLDSMEKFSSVHLACHASQDAKNPLQSRFLFHNGSLDLFTILQRSLKDADLAFLSACQTGTGAEKLPDEAVHLAAGMLAAGYRRVVATMWAIRDKHAPRVATDFYQYLVDHRDTVDGSGFDGTHAARGLHYATQQLRLRLGDNSDQSLLAWISYVHFGY